MASTRDLQVDEVATSTPIDRDHFQIVPIKLRGEGTFPDIAGLLHDIHGAHADIRITSFELTGNSTTAGSPTRFTIDLEWFAALEKAE